MDNTSGLTFQKALLDFVIEAKTSERPSPQEAFASSSSQDTFQRSVTLAGKLQPYIYRETNLPNDSTQRQNLDLAKQSAPKKKKSSFRQFICDCL